MDPYTDIGVSAQQQQDEATRGRIRLAPNSRQTLEALLAKKEKDSSGPLPSDNFDHIGAVARKTGLTRAEVIEIAEAHGF
jgi:hypothetical protein